MNQNGNNNNISENLGTENEMYRIVVEDTKPMGFISRFVSLFVSPTKLMQNISLYQKFLQPMVILALIAIAMMPFTSKLEQVVYAEQSIIFVERFGSDFLNFSQMPSSIETLGTAYYLITFVGGLIGFVIAILYMTIVLKILTAFFRGTAKFKQYFSMISHTAIISSIGGLISTIVSVAISSTLNVTSLAAVFMPNGNFTMIEYNFLSAITIFSIWEFVLIFIGVKEINGFSKVKAAVLVCLLFVISMAIMAGISYIPVMSYDAIFQGLPK